MKKMFNIMRTTLVLALLVMVSSCLKVDIVLPEQETSNVSLSFISRDIAQTRAAAGTEKGDDSENVVESIDVFFYDKDAGDDDNALYHMRIEDNDLVASTDNSTDNINYSYTASIPTDVIKRIFGENTTCKIYAIANISANTEFQSTSITDLKETILNTDFSQNQTSFVMSGESSNITFDSSIRKISGSVNLYRSASKIDLIIKQVLDIPVTDEYGNQKKDSNGNLVVWKAKTDGMILNLLNGVKRSYVEGYCELSSGDYFNIENIKLVSNADNGWKHEAPFYTYPSDWQKEEATETYLKLIVPWSKSDAPEVYYNTYYTIPISETRLVRNTYYKIELTVGRLGTFDEGEDVVLTPASYYIYDWSTNEISTELLDYRYLVVNQKEYTIYNQEELYIPFSSSHETEIVDVTFSQQNINVTTVEPSWNTISSDNLDLDIIGNQVYFKNELDNVYTSDTFDFTPYKVTFTLCHTGEYGDTYYENITITQYPAIFGGFRQNSDYSSNGGTRNGDNGYVFVNGYQGSSAPSGTDTFLSANGVANISGTYSPNMYEFTITSVEGTDYIIGDPRETTVTYNENSARWATAVSTTSTTKRELTNYYGTENSERTRNMIAPKFRLASAYGALSTSASASENLETLRKRCASYQEDGYPAGRWRLPTEAEFKFIMTQVNRNPATLPPMYLKGYQYWCAHGLGVIADDGTTTVSRVTSDDKGHSTRCVYDTWYWGDDRLSDPDVFTWGDEPR